MKFKKHYSLKEAYLDKEEKFYDYKTGTVNGDDIFDKHKTGFSYYDNFLNKEDAEYMEKTRNLVGGILYMTPNEYFKECASIFGKSVENQIYQTKADTETIEHLKEVINKYKRKFPLPYLNTATKQQEGRHRMYVAGELFGWDTRFPVLVVQDKNNIRVKTEPLFEDLPVDSSWDYRAITNEIVNNLEELDYWDQTILFPYVYTDYWEGEVKGCDIEATYYNEEDIECAWLQIRIYEYQQAITFRQIDVYEDGGMQKTGLGKELVRSVLEAVPKGTKILVHLDISGGFWRHMSQSFKDYDWDKSLHEDNLVESGYSGYSMSNNAVSAYDGGEKPYSKWTKQDILTAIKEIDKDKFLLLKNVSADLLKKLFLIRSSWHHTSSYYNRTNFYSIDEEKIESITKSEIDNILTSREKTQTTIKDEPIVKKGRIDYLTWGGTRKHPKPEEHHLDNVNIEERGSFYIVTDDSGREILRKMKGSNGTYVRYNT